MTAVFKREFKSFFTNPLGFIFLTVYYLFLGIFFINYFGSGYPDVNYVVASMYSIVVFTVPVITMRTFSEERRQKIDQVLFTAPVKLSSIVFGKFVAALAIFALAFAPTLIFEIIVASFVSVSVFPYIYSLLGMLLLGSALISIGMFISSLTESTVVSTVLSLVTNIVLLFLSSLMDLITLPEKGATIISKAYYYVVTYLFKFVEQLDFISRYDSFTEQMLSIADIIYFVSIIAAFLFLTERSLEKRRWS